MKNFLHQRRKDYLWPLRLPVLQPLRPPGRGLALGWGMEASGSHAGLPGEVYGRRASGWLLLKPLLQDGHRLELVWWHWARGVAGSAGPDQQVVWGLGRAGGASSALALRGPVKRLL